MVDFLHTNEAIERKSLRRPFRLFACACCRELWHILSDAGRAALEAAEAFADGTLNNKGRKEAQAKQQVAYTELLFANRADPVELATTGTAGWTLQAAHPHQIATQAAKHACEALELERSGGRPTPPGDSTLAARRKQADLLRDILGPVPFRTVAVDPACLRWRDGTVHKVATAISSDRAFDRLPILADALEEAGCSDAEILAHCRGPGPHVLGCWVVDLILAKE